MGHGQNPLSTAGDLVFVGMVDGYFLALDAATGKELWRFQTGAAISAGAVTYTIDGEQYVAVFAGGPAFLTATRVTGRFALGVQAGRHLQDGIGQQRGSDAGAAHDSPAGRWQCRWKAAR